MKDELIDGLFEALIPVLTEKSIQAIMTTKQKRAILKAVNVKVEEVNENSFSVSMLNVVLHADHSDPDNPKLSLQIDLNALI